MSRRVLVIGLDGATFDIIHPLLKEGRLPNLARLMDSGTSGNLMSTIPPITPPAWTSFMTGKNPAKHGVFEFAHHAGSGPGGDLKLVSYNSIAVPTLWDILSTKNKKMILINIPLTYPPPAINGIVISGLMTPNDSRHFVHPPDLQEKIDREGYRVDFHPLTDIGTRKKEEWLRDYFDIEEHRLKTAVELLRNHEWDLSMIVFGVTDRIQHFCWNEVREMLDSSSSLSGSVAEAYELSDRMVGALLDEIDDETHVVVLSDHGFGAVDKVFFANRWLLDNGFLHLLSPSPGHWRDVYSFAIHPVPVRGLLNRFGMRALAERLPDAIAGLKVRLPLFRRKVSPSVVDWDKTVAYFDSFGIYVNRKGRESHGIVETDEDYEAIRDRIISRLYDLRDPVTGDKIVDIAVRREEVYSGPHVETAPDVLFQIRNFSYLLNRSFYFRRLFMPNRSGHHRLEGIFIARGPGVKRGSTITGAEIIDMTPTILYEMGLGIPDDMDGRVLESIFEAKHLADHEMTFEPAARFRRLVEHDVYTPEELEKIKASLSALGYLS
ncbi:MAG: alkaline phosphatase family protein [Candidatus Eisenbacteria bacterium]